MIFSSNRVNRNFLRSALLATVIGIAAIESAVADNIDDCAPRDNIVPVCGFHHPEDLELMPGSRVFVVSEYGSLDGSSPGALASFRIADHRIERIYPREGGFGGAPTRGWGDPSCPGPPTSAFDPHGLHHSEVGGRERLLVVNHGGREAVELFEIDFNDDESSPKLVWRGCVVAPSGTWMNDVVGLPDGGLAVSHMMPRNSSSEAIHAAEASKAATGYALEWQAADGWMRLTGTEGSLTNGLEVSADGSILYINYYFGDEVVAYDRHNAKRLWSAVVAAPDNSSWTADGRLLVASHDASIDEVAHCGEHVTTFCPIRYEVVAIDPSNGDAQTIFRGGGEPFGGATVAVMVGDRIYLGSYAGDRMAIYTRAP